MARPRHDDGLSKIPSLQKAFSLFAIVSAIAAIDDDAFIFAFSLHFFKRFRRMATTTG